MESNQKQSIFFNLPSEVRLEIYKFCISFLQKKRLLIDMDHLKRVRQLGETPSFLLTCKRIHKEAKPVLCALATLTLHCIWENYMQPIFRGIWPLKLSLVRDLRIELRPHYLESWWSICEFFRDYEADLQNLRILHVHYAKQRVNPLYQWHQGGHSALEILTRNKVVASLISLAVVLDKLETIKISGHWPYGLEEARRDIEEPLKRRQRQVEILTVSEDGARLEL